MSTDRLELIPLPVCEAVSGCLLLVDGLGFGRSLFFEASLNPLYITRLQRLEVLLDKVLTGNEQHIGSGWKVSLVEPENFSQKPFRTVAVDGITNSPRSDYAESRAGMFKSAILA